MRVVTTARVRLASVAAGARKAIMLETGKLREFAICYLQSKAPDGREAFDANKRSGEELRFHSLRPSSSLKVCLLSVNVCKENVWICKSLKVRFLSRHPSSHQATSLGVDFFCDPPRDCGNHFAGGEAGGLNDQPIVHAGDGEGASLHDGAVAVEGDFVGIHRSELFEQPGFLSACSLGESGVRCSGAETRHRNTGVAEFVGDSFRERDYICLGSVINRHQRARLKSSGGGDIHDAPAATLHHGWQEEACELCESGDVEVDLAEDLFFGHLREIAEGAEAGIVDENVDGNVGELDLVEEELRCRWRGQVESNRLYRYAVRLQFCGDLCEFVGA